MAEAPEVETIVRDLRTAVVGRVFVGAEVVRPEAVRFPAPDVFAALLTGRAVLGAERRAKHILLPLSDDLLLEMHFMLWGNLLLVPATQRCFPETMIVYRLDDGMELRLVDKLGYARAALGHPEEVIERLDLASLGPDMLDPSFDAATLARQIGKRRGALKSVLLNQRIVAGLGNRDTDESLWLAGIDPRRAPTSLTTDELIRLHAAIRRTVPDEGLALRGTQRDLFGRQGQAKHRRHIFERTGQPCPRCGAPIQHTRIGGRNTHFCPSCQR
jgi:formamidopyrimidine-DNA glycosylase